MTKEEKREYILARVAEDMKDLVGRVLDSFPANIWNGSPKSIALWLSDDRQKEYESVLSESERDIFDEYVLLGDFMPWTW